MVMVHCFKRFAQCSRGGERRLACSRKFDVVDAGGGFAGAVYIILWGAVGKDGSRRVALIAERNVSIFKLT